MSKKTKRSISTFAILLAVMLLVSIATWLAAGKTYTGENGEMAEVVGASASDIFMGPVNGFADASDVITFVFCLGAFLAIVNATGLGTWLVEASVTALSQSGVSAGVFALLDYILHVGLSFLVPSSSGLAGLSAPIVSPIVAGMGWSVETSIMINVAANGFVNLFTPTCGFIMGGLALARVPYESWLKWAWKLLLTLFIVVGVVLTIAMAVLS